MSVGTTSPESARRSTAKYAANPKNKKLIAAKRAVEAAKRRGDLKPPASCPKCGRKVRLDYHHTNGNYTPGTALKGVWRCRRCHSSEKTDSGQHERSGAAQRRARKKAEQTRKSH